ncbi:DNA-binding transcriptional regulator, FadR family [Marinospirillum celere]|uniref:DNA-binding transcriptional regulator, FadR family n=1 Tax=Marinospirillum celere TaxID=1122252 RepID=A0A1I1JQ61_9GAMM|nr:FCD domain-containing protein [Marinospirillum celere]SFC48678.1 DNA-binding transcriptional regulator, FadR family [Marinospirillum celere]
MNTEFEGLSSPRKMKRSDQIVEAVKRWVVVKDIQPGDRLPNEKALMELFECSKGTVREALKSLEVQGLIRLKTGPKGGAVLASVPYPLASQLLRNYLHFHYPTGPDIYRLRKLVEPELAALVVGRLTEEDLSLLEQLTEQCAQPPQSLEERLQQRIAELDFHSVLAERCPDPLLAFIGRFLNDLIKDLVIYQKVHLPEQVEFSKDNLEYHRKLLVAFREESTEQVRQLMYEHMLSAEKFNQELQGQLTSGLLTQLDSLTSQS